MLQSLLGQQGTDVLTADGTKSALDSPQTRNALQFMDKVFNGLR
jgi:hypothetical protein